MRIILPLLVSFFVFSGIAKESKKQSVPKKVQGTIKDLYCGDLSKFKSGEAGWKQSDENENKPISGRCLFFVDNKNHGKLGIISSSNSWVTHIVPTDESHSIVIDRKASFSSCDPVEERHMKQIKASGMPKKDIMYMDCYPSYTKLEIPKDVMIMPASVKGDYVNKRGDKASVTVTIISQGTLFDPPTYSVDIEYTKKNGSEAYIDFGSDDLYYYNNMFRPYFAGSYRDDCDDPDCFNTDGSVKFLKNSKTDYTLYLEFEHYNNAPTEYDDEYDFGEKVFLKKVK